MKPIIHYKAISCYSSLCKPVSFKLPRVRMAPGHIVIFMQVHGYANSGRFPSLCLCVKTFQKMKNMLAGLVSVHGKTSSHRDRPLLRCSNHFLISSTIKHCISYFNPYQTVWVYKIILYCNLSSIQGYVWIITLYVLPLSVPYHRSVVCTTVSWCIITQFVLVMGMID